MKLPWIVRRLVVAPLAVVLDVVLLVLTPVALLLGVLLLPLLGTRPLRLAAIVAVYAFRHLEALARLLALWPRRGDREAHYAVMRRFVGAVYRAIVRCARVQVALDEADAGHRALVAGERPVLLLSRHAGEGDTLLVVHELLVRHGRRPHVVMHQALRLDPLIDLLGTRLPNRFVDPRGGDIEKDIAALAHEMGPRDALIIFPEGANFSEARRQRGIDRLLHRGHDRQAEMARAMRHVSAPRPGGALAAIDAAPGADVVVLGHVGFPHGLGEMWDLLPRRQTIELKLWHVPAEAVPAGPVERIDWLFGLWRELDAWVDQRTGARLGSAA